MKSISRKVKELVLPLQIEKIHEVNPKFILMRFLTAARHGNRGLGLFRKKPRFNSERPLSSRFAAEPIVYSPYGSKPKRKRDKRLALMSAKTGQRYEYVSIFQIEAEKRNL